MRPNEGYKMITRYQVSAAQRKIDPGYDVAALGRDLDFIGIMTYDLHGAWDRITGFNSPLFARSATSTAGRV